MPTHKRLPFYFDELIVPKQTAAGLGYRMPGEFEPVEAVWLTYPIEPTTWPGCFDLACEQYDYFISQASRFARVELINRKHGWAVNDSWVRDYGPIFVRNEAGELACHDFVFNGWGGKYMGYPDDDVVPQRVAKLMGIPIWVHDFILEGGSIDANGRGSLLTTEQCLLAATRNPEFDRAGIERVLADTLGATNVIWLPGGIEGDDTDGHIDDLARFVSATTIAAIRAPRGHHDHEVLERNWRALEAARDQDGRPFELVDLPVPEPRYYDYPEDEWGPAEARVTPASYANFLILTEAVLVPVFDQPTDDVACRALERAMPGRSVVPVPAQHLVVGLGSLHCLSQHQPRT